MLHAIFLASDHCLVHFGAPPSIRGDGARQELRAWTRSLVRATRPQSASLWRRAARGAREAGKHALRVEDEIGQPVTADRSCESVCQASESCALPYHQSRLYACAIYI